LENGLSGTAKNEVVIESTVESIGIIDTLDVLDISA
jgi:hypothetical protein